MTLDFGSVCSGIEAASVAFRPLGWRPAWLAEIDPFASALLAHHYPEVPNLGDMTSIADRIDAREIAAPGLLCGGTPCQSFSVAGLRQSLGDARGNLSLEFIRIADAIDRVRLADGKPPAWIVWENVPGVLSVADNAFGSFLGGLSGGDAAVDMPDEGWSDAGLVAGPQRVVAWRTLDAQFFGLAQRRKRVFVLALGGPGGWAAADALLPVSDRMSWHPAPSRQARQAVTGSLGAGSPRSGSRFGRREAAAGQLIPEVAGTLRSKSGGGCGPGPDDAKQGMLIAREIVSTLDASFHRLQGASGQDANHGHSHLVVAPQPFEVANCLTARMHKGINSSVDEGQTPVLAHALRGEGFDASEDGTGRGTPLVPVAIRTNQQGANGIGHSDDLTHTLDSTNGQAIAIPSPLPFDTTQLTHAANRSNPQPGDPCHPLAAGAHPPAIAFDARQSDVIQYGEKSGPLDTCGVSVGVLHALDWQNSAGGPNSVDTFQTLTADRTPAIVGMQVRRLTPRECERLQGFADDYTLIPYRGKPAADGPRYKALGNSWAVPCARWIGRRIEEVA